MTKKMKDTFTFRIDSKLREALEKEAEADKRKLADYIRLLLETHPARQSKKKS